MRIVIVAILFMAGVAAAQAQGGSAGTQTQSGGLEGVDVIAAGIYKLGATKEIKDRTISTGQRTVANTTLVRRTTNIPAKPEMVFGIDIHILGKPAGRSVPLHIVWRYPQPGLKNPATGTAKLSDEYDETRKLDETTTYYWTLGPDWTLVPGEWVIEIWSSDKMLAKQTFQLQR